MKIHKNKKGHLTTQFGEKRQKFLFSRIQSKLGKVNIFQISEIAQWRNSLTLSVQNYKVLFSVAEALRV